MNLPKIKTIYKNSTLIQQVLNLLESSTKINIKGTVGSASTFITTCVFENIETPMLVLFPNKEEAAYFFNEAEKLLDNYRVLFLPSSYRKSNQIEQIESHSILRRTQVLNYIKRTKKNYIVISYADAIYEKVITKKKFEKYTFSIKKDSQYDIENIIDTLISYDFKRVDFVSEAGEFSVRGSILDVFSFGNDMPYRIDFFDDQVESIRLFNIENQLSIQQVNEAYIIANIVDKDNNTDRIHLLEYLSQNTLVVVGSNLEITIDTINKNFEKIPKNYQNIFSTSEQFTNQLNNFSVLEFSKPYFETNQIVNSYFNPQPSFNKNFEMLAENFVQNTKEGFINILFYTDQKQVERLQEIFKSMQLDVNFSTVNFPLHSGFIDETQKIVCYTEHQIFERYQKFVLKNNKSAKQTITLKELNSLKVGDFVTHIDYGIGKFAGLQKVEKNGKLQEVIKLIYKNNDLLFVGVHYLHKISKYTGKEGSLVKINKLGSPSWKATKNKAKNKIKEIAFDLIKLYAKRKDQKGFQFSPDTYLQHELEASFLYEETPDQLSVMTAVKEDMESEQPMDRLVCGDVGFGKTEVAVRAAFKAVADSKQVAILVPTTILTYQHYQTFTKRFKDLPCRVEYINRFKSIKQKKQIKQDLADGKIDVIIGTHQLTGKTFKYNDLGLLIIDEEQKFGVAIKDKLKAIKTSIDTLTLTATPIPRTLQFSLMAARDLSIINTPPRNRQPIETSIVGFDDDTIRDAIEYELSRGGQIFFINNRVANIREVSDMIKRLVPSARVKFAHGQMNGTELEKITLDFINAKFDVLVATTIIENGFDVPNANTIFINGAHNFGLSDLHQMRGRVGRSNKKSFCYFIAPPYSVMTSDAKKRLEALEQFSDLGSGFKIAMKDLEIRGAGDLLGGQQSGFITDIGFDTYQKILDEAIQELKESDFKELYKDTQQDKLINFSKDCNLETDFEIFIPQTYVGSVSERLILYNKLNHLKTKKELENFEKELVDRFGKMPLPTKDLLQSLLIKWNAMRLGFQKIVMKAGEMRGYFINNTNSNFFETNIFTNVLNFVQQNPLKCVMKQKEIKGEMNLIITFKNIYQIEKAIDILEKI